jgi:hypothetical protein
MASTIRDPEPLTAAAAGPTDFAAFYARTSGASMRCACVSQVTPPAPPS